MRGEGVTGSWWSRSIVVLVLAIAFFSLVPAVADPDLWGHIRFGQLTWAAGSVVREDPFSYLTAGYEWVNHEWLSEVVFAGLYALGGGRALLLFKLALALLIAGLVYRHLCRAGLDELRAGLVLFAVVILLMPGLLTVRPQAFTFLAFLITLCILYAAEMGRPRALWFLPPLFAAWINFHGGVLAGLGVVGIWAFGRALSAWPRIRANLIEGLRELWLPAAVIAGCAVALLLNPYGIGLPAFLLRTGTVPRLDIIEWQPLQIASPRGGVYLVSLAFAAFAMLRGNGPRNTPLLLVFAVLALLPLTAVRHLQLYALGFGVLLADRMAAAWSRHPAPGAGGTNRLRPIFVGLTLASAAMFTLRGAPHLRCIRIDTQRSIPFPARAVEWLDRSGVEGNLAVYFDWGEYALWHLAPEIRVSMDGRRETVYPDSIYAEYFRFQNGIGEWQDLLEKRPTDLVLFPKARPVFNLMSLQPGWQKVYEDDLGGVFARVGRPQLVALSGTPVPEVPYNGHGLCVP
jgi:hypothetical protein